MAVFNKREERFEARLAGRRYCSLDLGNDSSPPAPDPAIGQAAAQNAEVGREALAFARQQYEDSRPRQAALDALVKSVADKQLELQDKSAAQADDYLAYMKSTFRPIEEGLAADAQAFDTEARREELAAAAGADVEQAAASSDAAAARDLARYGINPADGAFADTMAGGAVNKTAMKVGAMNNARTQARAEGRAFKFDVAGLGRNLPSAGATSTSLALNAGNAAVGNAGAPGANARSDAALFQNGLGSSVAATNSAGNLYSNIFDGQMRGYAADQSASASASAGFGNFASMAAYKMLPQLSFSSSKKLKKAHGDVDEKAAVRAIKKLGIQRWRYNKDASPDQAMHVGPYAEDFRKEMKIGDGKTISVIDAVGVTLAAVKGLAKSQDSLRRDVARLASHGLS